MNRQDINQGNETEELAFSKTAFAGKLAQLTLKNDSPETAIAALSIRRCEEPTELTSYIHEPSICLIAQGSKRVILGGILLRIRCPSLSDRFCEPAYCGPGT